MESLWRISRSDCLLHTLEHLPLRNSMSLRVARKDAETGASKRHAESSTF